MASLGRMQHIKLEDIPNIDLYMDQVTTFMERKLKNTTRYPDEDKILTKTMINNYAKNRLLPAPQKKKYNSEHMLLLIFIYYFKGILSISDIQSLLKSITEKYFSRDNGITLKDIYQEVFSLESAQMEVLREDVLQKFSCAKELFRDAPEDEQEQLQLFSFICLLSFDVYMKKQMIERMIDRMNSPEYP